MRQCRRPLGALRPCAAFWVLALGLGARSARPEDPLPSETPIVRVSLEVVQVDAVVTDGEGRHVADLRAEDFEIREDGRPREITHCTYVRTGDAPPSSPTAPLVAAPRPAGRPERVRRTIAFVVDDLSLSFVSVVRVRNLLKTFVDEQMQAGDLVAIVRAAAGMGALQQFTADKRQLHAAIEGIRFALFRRVIGGFDLSPEPTLGGGGGPAAQALAAQAARLRALEAKGETQRAVYSTAGTIGALHFVFRGLRPLPGRKSVVLLSEGISLDDEDGRSPWLTDALQRTSEAANRAATVVYSIDPTGLKTLRPNEVEIRHAGMSQLSQDTGGLLLPDTNDLKGAVAAALDDQKGYYLIGYAPDDATFRDDGRRGARYRKIEVRIRRPGLRVRTRAGFYAVPDRAPEPAPVDPDAQVLSAAASPFGAADVRVSVTALFGHDPQLGSRLRTLLHLDARDLTLEPQEDGSHVTGIRVVALAVDTIGRITGRFGRQDRLRIAKGGLDVALRDGLLYVFDLPVLAPGPHQLRAAIRDDASGRLGWASQFVEVPDVSHGRMGLSGIVLAEAADRQPSSFVASAPLSPPRAAGNPAVRRFAPDSTVSYSLFVYNPRVDPRTRRTALDLRVSLSKDGVEVRSFPVRRVEGSLGPDSRALALGGDFHLEPGMTPGSYAMGVAVRDSLAKKAVQDQWIDFEVADPAQGERPGSD